MSNGMHVRDPLDKELTCGDCGDKFWFTKRDQDFYKEKNLSEPKRCKPCREKRKASRESGGGYGSRDRR